MWLWTLLVKQTHYKKVNTTHTQLPSLVHMINDKLSDSPHLEFDTLMKKIAGKTRLSIHTLDKPQYSELHMQQ